MLSIEFDTLKISKFDFSYDDRILDKVPEIEAPFARFNFLKCAEAMVIHQKQKETLEERPCLVDLNSLKISLIDNYSTKVKGKIIPKDEQKIEILNSGNWKINFIMSNKEIDLDNIILGIDDIGFAKKICPRSVQLTANIPYLEFNLDIAEINILDKLYNFWLNGPPVIIDFKSENISSEMGNKKLKQELLEDDFIKNYSYSGALINILNQHQFFLSHINLAGISFNLKEDDKQLLSLNLVGLDIENSQKFFVNSLNFTLSSLLVIIDEDNMIINFEDYQNPIKLNMSFIHPIYSEIMDIYIMKHKNLSHSKIRTEIYNSNHLIVCIDPSNLRNLYLKFKKNLAMNLEVYDKEIKRQEEENIRSIKVIYKNKKKFEEKDKLKDVSEEWNIENCIELIFPKVTVVFYHKSKEFFSINARNLIYKQYSYPDLTVVKEIILEDFKALDLSPLNSYYKKIIEGKPGEKAQLSILMRSLNNFETAQHCYNCYIGIHITGALVYYIKRSNNEIVEYIRFRLMNCFSEENSEQLQDENEEIPENTTFMEILIQEPILVLPRSTISHQAIVANIEKIGFWNTGKWGNNFGHLIKHEHFEIEMLKRDVFYDLTEDPENLDSNTFRFRHNLSPSKRSVSEELTYRVAVFGFKAKTVSDITNKKSLEKVKTENEFFRVQNPIKVQIFFKKDKIGIFTPDYMQIDVKIKSLLFNTYDDDYHIFLKTILEGFGECPIQCVSRQKIDYSQKKVWNLLKIEVETMMLKCYEYDRDDTLFHLLNKKLSFNKKNTQSLGILTIGDLSAKIKLYDIGGQDIIATAQSLNIYDYRLFSFLKQNKKILFDIKPRENASSSQNFYSKKFRSEILKKEMELIEGKVIDEGKFIESMDSMFQKYMINDDKLKNLKDVLVLRTKDEGIDILNQEKKSLLKKIERKRRNLELMRKVVNLKRSGQLKKLSRKPGDNGEIEDEEEIDALGGVKEGKKGGFFNKCLNFFKKFNCCKKKKKGVKDLELDCELEGGEKVEKIVETARGDVEKKKKVLIKEVREPQEPEEIEEEDPEELKYIRPEVQWIIEDVSHTRKMDDRLKKRSIKGSKTQFRLEMYSKFDGEKLILIKLKDKGLKIIPDFLMKFSNFLKKPMMIPESTHYLKQAPFNNSPQQIYKIQVENFSLILEQSFEKNYKSKILLDTNLVAKFEYRGEVLLGPGIQIQDIELEILNVYNTNFEEFIRKKNKEGDLEGPISMLNDSILKFESIYSAPKIKKDHPNVNPFQQFKCSIFEGKENLVRFNLPVQVVKTLSNVGNLLSKPSENPNKKIINRKKTLDTLWQKKWHDASLKENPNVEYMFLIKNVHVGLYKELKGAELMCLDIYNVSLALLKEKKVLENNDLLMQKIALDRRRQIFMKKLSFLCKNKDIVILVNSGLFQCTLGVKYFNYKQLEMEPFIEDWSLEGRYLEIDKVKALEITTPPIPEKIKKIKTKDQIKNMNSLNVNISSQFIIIAHELYKCYSKKKQKISARSHFKNYTGFKMKLIKDKTEVTINKQLDDQPIKSLEISKRLPWTIEILDTEIRASDIINKTFESSSFNAFSRKNSIKSNNGSISTFNKRYGKKHEISTFKTLKNVYLDTLGERCFVLEEFQRENANKGQFSVQRRFIRDKKKKKDHHDLYFFYSTANDGVTSTISINFFSSIQVKNEMNIDLKLELNASSGYETDDLTLKEGESNFIPITFCTSNTIMTIIKKSEENIYADSENDNVIDFSKFMVSDNLKSDFQPANNFLIHEKSKTKWNYVREKEFNIMIDYGKGEKVHFCATVSVRKIDVSNKQENEFTFAYSIIFHPYLRISNYTPKRLNLSIYTPTDTIEINSKDLEPDQSLSVEMVRVTEKTSIGIKIDNNFGKGKDFYPFRKMNKKIKIVPMLFSSDKIHKNNRLVLKLELRRVSSGCIDIIIFCPFLIFNETEMELFYKGSKYLSKTYHETVNRYLAYNELEQEDEIDFKEMTPEERELYQAEKIRIKKENFERALTMVEMFGPETGPKKMSISMTKKTWSNPFALRLNGAGDFTILENYKDQEILREMNTNRNKTKNVKKN